MEHTDAPRKRSLEGFRSYLLLLARMQLDGGARHRIDASDNRGIDRRQLPSRVHLTLLRPARYRRRHIPRAGTQRAVDVPRSPAVLRLVCRAPLPSSPRQPTGRCLPRPRTLRALRRSPSLGRRQQRRQRCLNASQRSCPSASPKVRAEASYSSVSLVGRDVPLGSLLVRLARVRCVQLLV